MKRLLKNFLLVISVVIITNCIVIYSYAMNEISDPMLIKAINNSIKQFFPERKESREILEADIPYVVKLEASNMGITDIIGLEQFTSINSIIDLSNNNISDITPLINWVSNKNDKNLNVDIFIGENPLLFKNNSQQIYTLLDMGNYIRVYHSQRKGEGVIELTGFINGRPTDKINLDSQSHVFTYDRDIVNNNNVADLKQDINNEDNSNNNNNIIPNIQIVNTGFNLSLINILIILNIFLGLLNIIFNNKSNKILK